MSTFPGWQASILHAIGAPVNKRNVRLLSTWQAEEGGTARNNPLNTTMDAPGATLYNRVVKNYPNSAVGTSATARTLLNGNYGRIVQLLRSGNADPAAFGSAVISSPWGTSSWPGGGRLVSGSKVSGGYRPGKAVSAPHAQPGPPPRPLPRLLPVVTKRFAPARMALPTQRSGVGELPGAPGQAGLRAQYRSYGRLQPQVQHSLRQIAGVLHTLAIPDAPPQPKPVSGGNIGGQVGRIISGRGPTATKGSIIGTPYAGTHKPGATTSPSWQSDNAVDISVPVGTPILAVRDGVVSRVHDQHGQYTEGWTITYSGGGDSFFNAHLSKVNVREGQHVRKGQVIGWSGSANGTAHLHFASERRDPRTYLV